MPRLYAAGEDTGGVHGANRLGGNGVANSTVFGGLAGDAMAAAVKSAGSARRSRSSARWRKPGERAFGPLGRRRSDLEGVAPAALRVMWNDVGVLRSAEGLRRARHGLERSRDRDRVMRRARSRDRRYNLTWMDRLNLENLVLVSRAICVAASERADSRGAHFREDHPELSDLATSRYTLARLDDERIEVETAPVVFSRVRPGETLLREAAE